jgi:hypothetical protein
VDSPEPEATLVLEDVAGEAAWKRLLPLVYSAVCETGAVLLTSMTCGRGCGEA